MPYSSRLASYVVRVAESPLIGGCDPVIQAALDATGSFLGIMMRSSYIMHDFRPPEGTRKTRATSTRMARRHLINCHRHVDVAHFEMMSDGIA